MSFRSSLSLALLLLVAAPAAGQNLLTNGDFEAGVTGWTSWSAPPGFWDSNWIHSTSDCIIWVPSPCPYAGTGSNQQYKGSGASNAHGGIYQAVTVEAGRQYRVSGAWSGGVLANVNGNNGTWWEVTAYDGAVSDAVIDQSPGAADTVVAKIEVNNLASAATHTFPWTTFSGVFTAQSNAVTLAIKTGSFFTFDTAGYYDDLVLELLALPAVDATKIWAHLVDDDGDGVVEPGDTIRYTVVITNPVDADGLDLTGVVFTDTPGGSTTLVAGSVTTSQGTVTTGNSPGDTIVEVDVGTVTEGTSIALVFDVTIDDPLPPNVTSVSNQGFVTGDNFAQTPTDDPTTAAPDDPTSIAGISSVLIPTAGEAGLILLALLLASASLFRLRRAR